MKRTNIMKGLFAIVMTLLMFSSSIAGLTSDSVLTVQADLGENVKLQIGQTLNVDGLNIYLDSISSSIVDSTASIVNIYDTATLVLTLSYSDTKPAAKYNLKVGESLTYNGYVIELTDITTKVIGITVSKRPVTASATNTVGFNELFKIKTGEEYTIGGRLKFTLTHVLPPGALGSPGQGLAEITVVESTNVADVAPTVLRFDSIPETKVYGDYAITLEDRGTGAAAFKVIWKADLSTGMPSQPVAFGEKFKGSVGSTFRVGGVFDVKITSINYNQYTEVIPSASVNVRYIGPIAASVNNVKSADTHKSNDYTLAVNENKLLDYNYRIELLEIGTNNAVFMINKNRPTVTLNNDSGIDLSISDSVVTATQIRIEPGARSPDVRSKSGVVKVDSEMLADGIDIRVSSGNALRVRTDSEKLETYLDNGNVTVRTRKTLKSNSDGIFVETESADVKLKVLPAAASERAKEVIAANFNEISLDEIEGKIVYRADGQMGFLVLGIFPVKGNVEVTIDAETGAVIGIDKPWYAVISG